jgi:protein gp37
MHPGWARSLRDQCTAAGVPFLFKQWGEWAPDGGSASATLGPSARSTSATPKDEHGAERRSVRVGKHVAGRELDGRTWDQYPTTTAVA